LRRASPGLQEAIDGRLLQCYNGLNPISVNTLVYSHFGERCGVRIKDRKVYLAIFHPVRVGRRKTHAITSSLLAALPSPRSAFPNAARHAGG
jgi:hypothetical protein